MTEIINDPEFKNDLQCRLFQFAVQAILLVRCLPKGKEYDVISLQFLKSSSSSGANYEEAQGAVSRADFSNKVAIVETDQIFGLNVDMLLSAWNFENYRKRKCRINAESFANS